MEIKGPELNRAKEAFFDMVEKAEDRMRELKVHEGCVHVPEGFEPTCSKEEFWFRAWELGVVSFEKLDKIRQHYSRIGIWKYRLCG